MLGFLGLAGVADIATVVLASATLLLVAAAVWAGVTAKRSVRIAAEGINAQIGEQRLIERRRRVYDHLGTYYSRSFVEMSADASQVFKAFATDMSAGESHWDGLSRHKRARVQLVLNFYEQVATEYNAGFLDRELSNRTLAYVALEMWDRAEPFIGWVRRQNQQYFEEWAELYKHKAEILDASEASTQRQADAAGSAAPAG
ncbi:MAG: DUF4760 domain-containing protein [Solirubrobacteraceae bacterium]|jgi:hypothetical protein